MEKPKSSRVKVKVFPWILSIKPVSVKTVEGYRRGGKAVVKQWDIISSCDVGAATAAEHLKRTGAQRRSRFKMRAEVGRERSDPRRHTFTLDWIVGVC